MKKYIFTVSETKYGTLEVISENENQAGRMVIDAYYENKTIFDSCKNVDIDIDSYEEIEDE